MRPSPERVPDAVDRIDISSPCSVPWSSMPGNDRVRYCGDCRQNVYNVAALSRDDARQLVERREGRVCVRILRRPDGTVVTNDCWTRLRAARHRGIVPWLVALVLVGFAELAAMSFGLSRLRSAFQKVVGETPALASDWDVPVTGLRRPPGNRTVPAVPPPPSRRTRELLGKPAPRGDSELMGLFLND
jgi:hypothetical protein